MKQILVLIFGCLAPFVFGQVNQTDAQGRKQGTWEKVYPGTRVFMYRGQFKDDRPVGKFTYFYPSAKKKAVITHDKGRKGRSEAYYYHENGVLMSFGIYSNQKKDSVWTNFGPSGRISNTETYVADELHGLKTVYFVPEDPNDKSKVVHALMNYEKGVLQGEYKEYFQNGKLMRKGKYVDGNKEGPWEDFHPNGKRSILYRYKDGLKHGYAIAYDTSQKRLGETFYYFGQRLTGKPLEDKLQQLEEKGINPYTMQTKP